jgi:predicted transcriptional regulator
MTTMKKRVSIEKISLKDAPSTKEIIEELAMSRMRSHMTQIEAAQASGLLQPVISKLEQGRHDPRLTTILKILDVYGKTLAIVPKAGAK